MRLSSTRAPRVFFRCGSGIGGHSLHNCIQLRKGIERQLGEGGGGVGVLRFFECVFAGRVGVQRGADGVARLETLAIDQQAAGAQVASAFDFDGDDIATACSEEIHLGFGIFLLTDPVAGGKVASGAQLLLHKLLGQSPFEFTEYIVVIQESAGIELADGR